MRRFFTALPIEDDIKPNLEYVYTELLQYKYKVKAVEPRNYHITVKFLGDCTDKIADKIEREFNSIPIRKEKIPFRLTGLGVFPDLKKPSVIWAGIKADERIFSTFQSDVEKYFAALGFKDDAKNFVPHLTLARIRNDEKLDSGLIKFIQENKNIEYGVSSLNRFVLFSSKLTPTGPIYNEIKTINFS